MAKIADIEGIGPAFSEKLVKCGIKTTDGLLKTGADKSGRKKIAGDTGIDEKMILGWVNKADLFRIKGVGSEYSDLLEASGVDTVKELRNRNAENLHAKMVEVNTAKKLVRQTPSLSMTQSWVEFAKTLEPMVTY